MNEYYYLAASLPELQIGYPSDLSFQQLRPMIRSNLTKEDFDQTKVMRLYYDIQNIRAFWKGDELDPRGFYDENALEEVLLTRIGLPGYLFDFIDKYDSNEERVSHFPELVEQYFQIESERAQGFLKEYLVFEREWRLVFAGFRAKKLGRELTVELQYEDPDDELVNQILAQKDAKSYEPPTRYSDLKGLFEEHYDEPLDLHQALCEYRFHKIDTLIGIELFGIGCILGFMAKLIIVEKWLELDKKKGLQIVETILEEAS